MPEPRKLDVDRLLFGLMLRQEAVMGELDAEQRHEACLLCRHDGGTGCALGRQGWPRIGDRCAAWAPLGAGDGR